MKKSIYIFITLVVFAICLTGCGNDYEDVEAQLVDNTWYYNGGNDLTLNSITFTEKDATVSVVTFDGNGRHENGSNACKFSIDDSNINVELEDSNLAIPYTMEDDTLKLGKGYLTIDEVEKGLQGYWMLHKSDYIASIGVQTESEDWLQIKDGKLKSENAGKALGGAPGEYYYYGPYSGKYTMGFGFFDTEMEHGSEWGFNIIDNKPVVLHYDNKCSRGKKFPGKYGYIFN